MDFRRCGCFDTRRSEEVESSYIVILPPHPSCLYAMRRIWGLRDIFAFRELGAVWVKRNARWKLAWNDDPFQLFKSRPRGPFEAGHEIAEQESRRNASDNRASDNCRADNIYSVGVITYHSMRGSGVLSTMYVNAPNLHLPAVKIKTCFFLHRQ